MGGQRFLLPEAAVEAFVQKPCFGAVSIGVKKQTQMMVVHQNTLSKVMLKNVNCQLKCEIDWKYARPEIYVVTYV